MFILYFYVYFRLFITNGSLCKSKTNETFIYWNRLRLTGPTVIEPRALLNPETYLHAQFHVNPCKFKGEV